MGENKIMRAQPKVENIMPVVSGYGFWLMNEWCVVGRVGAWKTQKPI